MSRLNEVEGAASRAQAVSKNSDALGLSWTDQNGVLLNWVANGAVNAGRPPRLTRK
jgi:hypothetical protein